MAITHSLATRNAIVQRIAQLVDEGSVLPVAELQLSSDSSFNNIALSIPLASPAFSAPSNGAIALNVPQQGLSREYTGSEARTINYFRIVNRAQQEVLRGTVTSTTGNGDLRLADNTLTAGTTVIITSFVYTTVP